MVYNWGKYDEERGQIVRKPKYTAQFVADWFVSRASRDAISRGKEPLTFRKLNNLMYIAQGIYLAVRGVPLFDGEITRGFNGPAVLFEVKDRVFNIQMKEHIGFVSARSNGDNAFLEMVYQEVGKVETKKLLSKIKSSSMYKTVEIGEPFNVDHIRLWCENIFLKEI